MTAGIVIIGAGMAGHRAALGLRAAGFDGAVTLVGEETLMPYDRPPLSKAAIADSAEPVPAWLMAQEGHNVDVLCGIAAQSIDRAAKNVWLSNGSALSYDRLLLATGAKPRKLAVPGGDRALLLRNFADAVALRQRFQPGKRIVIIGGGFIGLELAASAVQRGCKVTLIEALPRILMRGVPEVIARIVHDRHRAAGVDIVTGVGLAAIGPDSVALADGREVPTNTVVAGIGAAPEVGLAEAAGLEIANGVAVDSTLRSADPDIFAAGDCCSFTHALFDHARIRLEAWRNALDQGQLVAENLLGAGKDYVAVPWFWSDQHDLSLQVSGLPQVGTTVVERRAAADILLLFHLAAAGRLVAVSGIGPGNAVARDIKLGEMLIAREAGPDPNALADPAVALKSLLKR